MNLDLRGKTVTEAVARIRAALSKAPQGPLVARTDNETVKLNLIREISRMGCFCRSERIGGLHQLTIEISGESSAEPEHAPPVRRQREPAFPLAHLSGEDEPGERGQPAVSPAQRGERKQWLILQSDQIGHRDPRLGFALMEDLLSHLDTTRYAGIFLVHRAVMLLDPGFQGGRALRILLRKNLPITACEKSVAYYEQEKNAVKPVRVAPFHVINEYAEHHDLVWM